MASTGTRNPLAIGAFHESIDRAALPTLVSIDDIATHLGVKVRHIRRLVAERRIPFYKWGHRLRFDPTEVRAWLDGARVEPLGHGSREPRRPGAARAVPVNPRRRANL